MPISKSQAFEVGGLRWAGIRGVAGRGPTAQWDLVVKWIDPFPNLIALHWFSFAEQKYYSTLIRVPSDLPERMREPVEHWYPDGTSDFKARRTLVLGLAPRSEEHTYELQSR